jgi:polynucleotide 5'-kinase involved in rRNA processing
VALTNISQVDCFTEADDCLSIHRDIHCTHTRDSRLTLLFYNSKDGFLNATDLPVVYFHGDTSPGTNPDLYKHLVTQLAEMVDARGATNPDSKASGLVLNTMGWVDGAGYKLLLHALDKFQITDILVVGADKLHATLQRDYRGKTNFNTNTPTQVWRLKKNGGVVERDQRFRKQTRVSISHPPHSAD